MKSVIATLHVRASDQAVPLAAGCLKAALPCEQQRQCTLLDFYLSENDETICHRILAEAPTVVAFPTYLWNRPRLKNIIDRLRKEKPQILLFAGGPEATADAEGLLNEMALDGVLRGEGERTFSALLQRLASDQSLENLAGLSVMTVGGPHHGPDHERCDLNTLPSPWLTGVLTPEAGGGVLWETARGCSFDCAFCYDARASKGVRPLNETRLVAELKLFAAHGVDRVWVLDSTFNAPPKRGKRLLRLIIQHAPDLHYHLEAKADFIDKETVTLLSQLHCSVQMGLQSIQPEVLTKINRPQHPPNLDQRIQWLAEAGVTYGFDLMYGLPDDNHEGFCQSLDFALNMRPNQVDIFPLAVLPGTALWEQARHEGLQAMHHPPYLVQADPQTVQLAAATDLFYNHGRAVGFFDSFCRLSKQSPASLLHDFWLWAIEQQGESALQQAENLDAQGVLCLQESFIRHHLRQQPQRALLLQNLARFHFYHAETILAPSTYSTDAPAETEAIYRLAEGVHLVDFDFSPETLLHAETRPAAHWPQTTTPCCVIFLRQGEQIIHEALDEEYAAFLRRCDGRRSAADAFGRPLDRQGLDGLNFALEQGLLLRVAP